MKIPLLKCKNSGRQQRGVALLMIQVLNLFSLSLKRHACEDIFKNAELYGGVEWNQEGISGEGCYFNASFPKLF